MSVRGRAARETGGREFYLIKLERGHNLYFRNLLADNWDAQWPVLARGSHPLPAQLPDWAEDVLGAGKARKLLGYILGPSPLYGVKGPPGTGKTYLLACAALAFALAGKRVVIAAVSHAAVNNALRQVQTLVQARGWEVQLARRGSSAKAHVEGIANDKLVPDWQIVGATLVNLAYWTHKEGKVADVLILDEAGQIPVFKAGAVSGAAPWVRVFGDDDQLAPILNGHHDLNKGMDKSVLGYMASKAESRPYTGFLEETFRLNEQLCQLIDEHFYNRLGLRSSRNARSRLHWDVPPAWDNGRAFQFLEVSHANNVDLSVEEIARCRELVDDLLRARIALEGRDPVDLRPEDILILSPYRWQTQRMQDEGFPDGVRIGTVDSMQGQSVGVVIYSMTTSCMHTLGMRSEWYFDLNRWNVALSRAKARALVVGAPVWKKPLACKTLEGWKRWTVISTLMAKG